MNQQNRSRLCLTARVSYREPAETEQALPYSSGELSWANRIGAGSALLLGWVLKIQEAGEALSWQCFFAPPTPPPLWRTWTRTVWELMGVHMTTDHAIQIAATKNRIHNTANMVETNGIIGSWWEFIFYKKKQLLPVEKDPASMGRLLLLLFLLLFLLIHPFPSFRFFLLVISSSVTSFPSPFSLAVLVLAFLFKICFFSCSRFFFVFFFLSSSFPVPSFDVSLHLMISWGGTRQKGLAMPFGHCCQPFY